MAENDAPESAIPQMDWQQVALNGGPPCFFIEGGQFCGRAEHWQGHGNPAFHDYVSLEQMVSFHVQAALIMPEGYTGEHVRELMLECVRTSLPDRFASRIRNQAGNIIFKVFGPQDLRSKPPSKIVQQLARLQDLITEALLAAHKASSADLAAPNAAQKAAKEVAQEIISAVQSFGYVVSDIQEAKLVRGMTAIVSKHFPTDAVRQARRETWLAAKEIVAKEPVIIEELTSPFAATKNLRRKIIWKMDDAALRAEGKGE